MLKKNQSQKPIIKTLWMCLLAHPFVFIALLSFGFSANISLQELVDNAEDNAIIILEPGIYDGPIIIESPITIDGQNKVTITANGKGSVVYLETDGATIKGCKLINSGKSHNDLDSGVQIRGNYNVVKDNIIEDCLFGIDLQQCNNCIVRRNTISSKDFDLGLRGDAIRLWYSFNNKIENNHVFNSRDVVVWYSADNRITDNTGENCRYSLHFMYSRYNHVEGNHYTNNAVGIFLMYSDGVVVKNNHISHAVGPTGVGIGFKETSDIKVTGNEILYCASGLYIDVSPFQPDVINYFEHNLIGYNGFGIRFLNDWHGNEFKKNQFIDNLTQISVGGSGGANRHLWEGNYWSDYEGFDRDNDTFGDTPHELYSYSDRLWQDVSHAQFFLGTPLLEVIDFLERLAPFSKPTLLLQDFKPSMIEIEPEEKIEEENSQDKLLKLLGK
jgi:nitrous oxidase accessory protein